MNRNGTRRNNTVWQSRWWLGAEKVANGGPHITKSAGDEVEHETGGRRIKKNNTFRTEFIMKMAMILQENEQIENLKFKPTTMVKNFKPKTQRRSKGISKVIFKYESKQLTKAER